MLRQLSAPGKKSEAAGTPERNARLRRARCADLLPRSSLQPFGRDLRRPLARCRRQLGTDGEALVQAALIHARSFRQIAEARGLSGQEWERYFAKRLWECLNSLAVVYGFANADRIHKT
jgi:hypothetical protein